METETIAEETSPPAPPPSSSTPAPVPHAAAAEEQESELDRPNVKMIGGIVFGTLALLVGIVIASQEIFRAVINHEISTKQLEHQGSELRELRAEEQAKLSRYQWVNRKDGVVRVPLDRARELTLASYKTRVVKPEAGGAAPQAPMGTQ